MLFTTLFLSAVALAAAANEIPANFVAFSNDKNLQDKVARLQALTTGTPITEFCVDDNGKALAVRFRRARATHREGDLCQKKRKKMLFFCCVGLRSTEVWLV